MEPEVSVPCEDWHLPSGIAEDGILLGCASRHFAGSLTLWVHLLDEANKILRSVSNPSPSNTASYPEEGTSRHLCVYSSLPLLHAKSQMNPLHAFLSHFQICVEKKN